MQVKVICSLRHAILSKKSHNFIFSGISLLQGKGELDGAIFRQFVVANAGEINIREFINNPFFFTNVTIEKEEHLTPISIKIFSLLGGFISFLWLSKDNSFDIGLLYSYFSEKDFILSRYKTGAISNSFGEYSECRISKADLEFALKAYLQFTMVQSPEKEGRKKAPQVSIDLRKPVIIDTNYHYADYNDNNRIQRAFSFVSMARYNSFLPLKISLYIAVLECLFTTDASEVSHKVSERVALYLGGKYEAKLKIYASIKAAYDVRSKFFHGQELNKNKDSREYLSAISKGLDEMLRVILNKVLFKDSVIFQGSNESLKDYYNKLIFSQRISSIIS